MRGGTGQAMGLQGKPSVYTKEANGSHFVPAGRVRSIMSQPPRSPRAAVAGPTVAYRPASHKSPVPPPCRVAAQCGGSGSQFYSEIETLLRSRLRLVSLLLLAPTAFFF